MRHYDVRIVAVLLLALWGVMSRGQARSQSGNGTANQDACAQIRRACRDAGFTPGAGLQKNCFQPILQGQTGSGLPQVDSAVVEGCKSSSSSSSSSAVSPAISVAGASSGGTHVQTPPGGGHGQANPDGLMMSQPQPLFTGPNLGMHDMPDQQTPIIRQPDGTYELFVTGVLPNQPGGVVSVFTTSDLTKASSYQSRGTVLGPPQNKKGGSPCASTDNSDACADYVGVEAVFPGGGSGKLTAFYIADQQQFSSTTTCPVPGAFYGQLMAATVPAKGGWPHGTATLRAALVPPSCPAKTTGPIGFNQPAVIKIGSEYYAYFALPPSGKPGVAVASAPVGPGGLPGSWSVLSNQQWIPVPTVSGVQTLNNADMVVPAPPGKQVPPPAVLPYVTMPWISFNTYLQTYLMTMVTRDGFYYSKLEKSSSQGAPTQGDLKTQKWTAPQLFQEVPGGHNWTQCYETWENVSFVTPGLSDNYTTGQAGYVILSVVPGWACKNKGARSFDIASYSFGVTTPPPPPISPSPRPTPKPAPCPGKYPCRQ